MAAKTKAVEAKAVTYDALQLYEFYGAPSPDGVTEKTLEFQLPRNTLPLKFQVVMRAATAHAVAAGAAGQVRATPVSSGVAAVVDFGTPRTVSAVAAPDGFSIQTISTWIGSEFGAPKYDKAPGSGANFVRLDSEVRTERLRVVVSGLPSTDQLATGMRLVLPEPPAGLELRIAGGAPVFSQTAAVDPSDATTLSDAEWNTNSQRVVDLAAALSSLLGDPLDESIVTLSVKLTSRVPGVLDLETAGSDGLDTPRIRRAMFNGQPVKDLAFAAEGDLSVALPSLPDGLTVLESHLTVIGKPPAERVVPPVGPDPPDPPFAVLSVTPNRAVCLRVPVEPRFAQLAGVRIPLTVGAAGAEARVLLWRSKDLGDQSPGEPLDMAASDPVTLDPNARGWWSFRWPQPLEPPAGTVLWAVLAVSRGDAEMTLADETAGFGAVELLWGSPTGPWHDLPAALLQPPAPGGNTAGWTSARGRIRVIGVPKPDTPFAPLEIAVAGGAFTAADPHPKGVAAALAAPSGSAAGPLELRVRSYAPGAVTLQDIDVISTA